MNFLNFPRDVKLIFEEFDPRGVFFDFKGGPRLENNFLEIFKSRGPFLTLEDKNTRDVRDFTRNLFHQD